ncbi:ATP-binding cassette domain-containing protein [Ancylomarina euxinus]|uniref:ATP-binding cassette domain-containing protein n=1 Tax=Ancylomarina euxinus TaxID=2283627 RepID=A0A425XYM7_9BACT|nr:efflux RND transporter permease subunit [Ancylomarina euxinus]MCZ4695699.1 efflux RND transporter permease subunit [Ancylomarina euxinus]MUP15998.1 ATP-binding cassette domain-containing protein [Ancylomarina euxinus]RRG20245.1 ATP-binding cassette domain-containing protein [Ancylomarina euxinus]
MNFIIKRKVLIAMLFTGLSMLGFFSYKQLPVELIPNAQLPMLFIQVSARQEVDPRYMENQAIIPLEGIVGSLEGVEKITSTAGQQSGNIQISFEQGTNTKYAYLKLAEKVEQAKKDLPKEFMVQVVKFDLEQLTNMFMNIQVRGSGGVDRVRQITQNEILDQIKNIDGIANVAIFGGREKSIEILLRDDVCKSYGISPSQVRSALSQNDNKRSFAGKVIESNRMHFVNVVSEFTDITDIHELVVKEQGKIKLKDIADIHFGVKEQSSYSRVNGKEAVTLQLTRDAQANIIDLSDTVIEKIAELNQELENKDVSIVVQSNSAETMKTNIDLIIELALVGGLLAIFVLWIFLKNIRLVVAIALAIPISVYTAFNFFYAYGISINTLTLLGMALAIGMLLDNSIVVLENIYRLAAKKIDADTAVIQGTKEVWRSIFAATLTTITVFLPFLFSSNFMIGLMGKHIGVSIISTLLVSLVVALLLIPMITHTFLKRKGNSRPVSFESISLHNRLVQIYLVLLKSCMRFPGKTILGALGLFFITLLISLGLSFMSKNEAEIKDINLYVTLPGGTTLNNTDLVIREVEKNLESLEEKKDITSQVYEEEAILSISLVDDYRDILNRSVPDIKKNILERLNNIPRASFSWEAPAKGRRFGGGGGDFGGDNPFMGMLGLGTQKEKLVIKGQDFDKMLDLSEDLRYYLEQLSSMERVSVKIPSKRPEMLLEMDKQIMAIYDIPVNSVLSELNSFQKEFSSGVTFKHGTDEYDIIIKTQGESSQETRDAKDLRRLTVKGNQGAEFELQNISQLNFTDGLSSIKRTNQEKQLEVEYQFIAEVNDEKDLLTAARVEVDELVERMNLPSGIALEIIHEENPLGEFGFLFLMAFILIFMILASVFESFTMPIVMMFSIPMAAIGSLVALILTGTSLINANVFTGFIILLGIVVNNGIIMIDYSNVLQKRGYRESRALIMAGLARIRPILITAITTIIALMPLALGRAEYVTEIGVPFAITVIGGLSLSTVLTLVFIPTVYAGLQTSLTWLRSQKLWVKSIQFTFWILGTYFIYTEVDSKIWQIITFLVLLLSVPACIYFISASLRKANEELIAPDEALHIEIRNLVKIYDWDNRFTREWKSGLKIRERLGLKQAYQSIHDFVVLIWQIPLVAFMVFFIFYHIQIQIWVLLLSILFQIMLLGFIKPIMAYRDHLKTEAKSKWIQFLIAVSQKTIFWFFPLFVLYYAYQKYDLIGLLIPIAVIWYLALVIKLSSDKIYRDKININRLKGRLSGLRKNFYRFVLLIPIIGKKKVPFKAVKGISLNIGNGMFGLLGPNGAGKSTLMRIICGILEQSYGQITINGIDVREKREELQGLIGYLPQEFGMYENMTAWDFLNYMGIIKKLKNNKERHERINYVLSAVHMLDQKDDKIGSFSGGMKQRIGIAQILLHLPRILVVDEPTAGLDPRERIRFRNLLVELSQDRIVIFSTHIIEDVASSCNRVGVVKKGELKYLGEPVHMAGIANEKVWILTVSTEEFEQLKTEHVIIHHMRDKDQIRVRCLSDENPGYGAINTKANLEDAYLCLLNEKEMAMT